MSEPIVNAIIQVTKDESRTIATEESAPTENQGEESGTFTEANSVGPVVDATVVDESSSPHANATPVAILQASTPPQLIDTCREFLEREGITYQAHPPKQESTVLSMFLTGKSASFKTFIEAREGQKRVLCYVESPVKVPEMRRSAAAEFLIRCNYSLALGNLEVDFRDGEVRFRIGIDVEGGTLSMEMMRQLVMVSAATMDRLFGGLMQVVYGSQLPTEAF